MASPRDPQRRGSHTCLAHPDALRTSRALISEAKAVGDFRVPDRLRLGPAARRPRRAARVGPHGLGLTFVMSTRALRTRRRD
ncbi:hypothetical protein ACIBJE_29300 [Micromonospora sp. NPDC050187]|uniref:kynureninase/PvdN C-terminal domain-containing protein n=1 Tax=Micromonospora sp. NPDC050187 TaxID=3364277 RepID=UPI00378AFC21